LGSGTSTYELYTSSMDPCEKIMACDVATFTDCGSMLVGVGLEIRGQDRFVIICFRDIAGCQHTVTKRDGAGILIEKLARVLRQANETK